MRINTVKDWFGTVDTDLGKKRLARQRKTVGTRLAGLSYYFLLDGETTFRLWREVADIFRKRGWWDDERSFLWEMVPETSRLPLAIEPTPRARIILFEGYTTASAITRDGEGLIRGAVYPRLPDAWIIELSGMLHCLPHEPYEQPFSLLLRYSKGLQNLLDEAAPIVEEVQHLQGKPFVPSTRVRKEYTN